MSDALKRLQTILAQMQQRNHAGVQGRWGHCDHVRRRAAHGRVLPLIQRCQLSDLSEDWAMMEGPEKLSGEALRKFDEWEPYIQTPQTKRVLRQR